MSRRNAGNPLEHSVRIAVDDTLLTGDLVVPERARGIVLFAHGSGSGRHSPRNRFVAGQLQAASLATLLFDLLTEEEEVIDRETAELRFDIGLLAERLIGATDWLADDPSTAHLRLGYFGASTGGGTALVAAARRSDRVEAVVNRGGRPDLAGDALRLVRAPTLLIVGGEDEPVIRLNREALAGLGAATKRLVVVPGATHLFEEPGKLERVAALAGDWFRLHLGMPLEQAAP